MVSRSVFVLGWRPIGSSRRRWQLHYCVDVAEAARLAAGLARSDGGGRWRVYDMATVPAGGGSVALARRHLVAEGVVRPPVRGTAAPVLSSLSASDARPRAWPHVQSRPFPRPQRG